jgi:hypothetical protein
MDWLKTVAPTVATALGGPLAGLAVNAIGDAFGWEDATKEKVVDMLQSGQLSSEQLAAIKLAEIELKKQEQEQGFRFAELDVKDRDSARRREADTKDNTNRILAFVIIAAFIAMVGATLMGWTKAETVLAGTLIGYLSAKAEQVLAYYFGSTSGSSRKTELLAQAPPVKE